MDPLKEILLLLNPWWKSGTVNPELAKQYKRDLFSDLWHLQKKRQIIILSGLRRVGKTTILYQLIEALLQEKDPKHVIYFTMDKKVDELLEVLRAYQELLDVDWKKEPVFLFIDEISKWEHWGSKLKLLYDTFPHLKFFISSSSSVALEEEAIKNLAGRYFLRNLEPLRFTEFLELQKKQKFIENPDLWETELKKEAKRYWFRSFPETIDWEEELLIKDYVRTTIIDKVIRQDIVERFEDINRDLLLSLIRLFYTEPGIYLNYDNLSKDLRVSKNTLYHHIFCLEFSYLIRKIKNFRVNTLSTSRKLLRIYAYWWNLAMCYADNEDKIMENLVASQLDARYYWRELNKEIDFLVVENKKVIPLEVKNKEEITPKDLETMFFFLKKNNLTRGILVYQGLEKTIKIDTKVIELKPLWKWLLGPKTMKSSQN